MRTDSLAVSSWKWSNLLSLTEFSAATYPRYIRFKWLFGESRFESGRADHFNANHQTSGMVEVGVGVRQYGLAS